MELLIPAKNQAAKLAESQQIGGQVEHCLRRDENGVFGYLAYRNNSTLEDFMSWDRPIDAIEIPVKLKFCTGP